MKRIIAILLIVSAIFTFCACASEGGTDTTADETTKLEVNNNPIVDYDENGSLILKSSDNRSVFREDDGTYVIFAFNGDVVTGILHVLVYNTNEEASADYQRVREMAASSDEYGTATLSDNHIALGVSPFHEKYGEYMRGGTRADVDVVYPDAMKLS